MSIIPRTTGLRLSSDGSLVVFDYGWNRDQVFTLTFYDPVSDSVIDIAGKTIAFSIHAKPAAAALVTGTVTLTDPTNGVGTMAIAAADFASLTFDLGESVKKYVITFKDGTDDVFDDTGGGIFPFRIHWRAA